MIILFLVLVVVACALLGFVILVQNPKGGGLAGNIAGFSNQFMGVKQTTDVLEKGTWIFATVIALLCLFSTFFMSGGSDDGGVINRINTNQGTTPAQQPATNPSTTPQPQPANPNQPRN